MKKNLRLTANILAAAFSLFLITSCGGPSPGSNSAANVSPKQTVGKSGGTLTYRMNRPVKTLNYFMADDVPSIVVTLFLINDRLVTFDHEKQQQVPMLAESYTLQADGQTLDVTLREGLKFSDGQPLTTADVEFTLKAIYDKRTASPIFRDSLLVGGQEIGSKIVDERRMQLIFPEKIAAVENYLENLAVMPKHALNKNFQEGTLSEAMKIAPDDPRSIVTSGPFVVDSVQPGERVVLKRNTNYWKRDEAGTQLPYLDSLVIEVVADANNAIARLREGTLDISDRIRSSDYAALIADDGGVKPFDAGPGLGTDHLWFNLNTAKSNGESLTNTAKYAWFSDKRFRRAVAYAVDRNSIATNQLRGLATPLHGFVPAGNRAWLDPNLPVKEYDLEQSRALLKEAGFVLRDNAGKPELFDSKGNRVEFTLIVPAEDESRGLMAAVIQEDLAKLGIAMQVAPIDNKGVTERWSDTFDYDAILAGTTQTGTDPAGFVTFLKSSSSAHQWHPKQQKPATAWEAKIDHLTTSLSEEPDPDVRRRAFNEIQAIMADETPVISIVSRHIVSAANQRVGNFVPASFLPYSLWNAERLYIR
ncbi:MAG: ABC transporter substrate-binding protein [Pyrinomonadaceae bacterium]